MYSGGASISGAPLNASISLHHHIPPSSGTGRSFCSTNCADHLALPEISCFSLSLLIQEHFVQHLIKPIDCRFSDKARPLMHQHTSDSLPNLSERIQQRFKHPHKKNHSRIYKHPQTGRTKNRNKHWTPNSKENKKTSCKTGRPAPASVEALPPGQLQRPGVMNYQHLLYQEASEFILSL